MRAFAVSREILQGGQDRAAIYHLYLHHTRYVNNWDLVDSSAGHIVGAHLVDKDRQIQIRLVGSDNLW